VLIPTKVCPTSTTAHSILQLGQKGTRTQGSSTESCEDTQKGDNPSAAWGSLSPHPERQKHTSTRSKCAEIVCCSQPDSPSAASRAQPVASTSTALRAKPRGTQPCEEGKPGQQCCMRRALCGVCPARRAKQPQH